MVIERMKGVYLFLCVSLSPSLLELLFSKNIIEPCKELQNPTVWHYKVTNWGNGLRHGMGNGGM